jgi:hypothetical protein
LFFLWEQILKNKQITRFQNKIHHFLSDGFYLFGYFDYLCKKLDMNKEVKSDDLWCNYSNLPSPLAYDECMDYDSMGNYGRFPTPKKKIKKEKNKKK